MRAGLSGGDVHGAVRLPHRQLSQPSRHRRQRLVLARRRARSGSGSSRTRSCRRRRSGRRPRPPIRRSPARTCSGGSTCTPRSTTRVTPRPMYPRRRPEAPRHLHGAGRAARRAQQRSASFRSSTSGDRARRFDRPNGSRRRRRHSSAVRADADAHLPAPPRLQPPARRPSSPGRRRGHSRRSTTCAADLIAFYEARGARVVVLSEYGLRDVSRPVHLNRAAPRAGTDRRARGAGRELLDPGASAAFAVADHQIAHVYVNDPARSRRVRGLLEAAPGVERVLDRDEQARVPHRPRARGRSRSPLPNRDAWFTYYYWLDDRPRARLRAHRRYPPQAGLRPGRAVPRSRDPPAGPDSRLEAGAEGRSASARCSTSFRSTPRWSKARTAAGRQMRTMMRRYSSRGVPS